MSTVVREKTVRWSDPLATASAARGMTGLDALRAIIAGELPPPPIVELFGIRLLSAEPGTVRMSLVPDESHYNPLGMVHGGAIATLMDSVMGCAVHTTMPLGRGYTTLNISVSYVRPVTTATGEVVAEGTVVHAGRSTAIAHGRLVDGQGKLLATAETTCLFFDAVALGKS
jgi:uncharacterized protein (TIGR00369 family)